MAIQLDDLVARLRLDTSGVQSGLRSVDSSLGSVGARATSAGRSLSLGMTAPLVGVGIAATKLAAGFDKTMRQVAIATGGPADALSDLAMRMGAETAFSAGEAADAMLELAKGGMTAVQIEGGALAATMKLASAGGVGLAEASTYVSNSMAAFGLAAKDADSVTVALAGAANASSASVESLGLGLSQAAASAKNAGLSLQETTGVLSLFDSLGLKGSDAGTSLKSMLNSLIPTTEKASDAMAQANLDFVDAEGNFVSVANMAEQLKRGLGGLSEAQRAQTLETIFGSDGMRAASALMNGGAEAVRKFTAASKDQKTTTELANAAMEGTSGAMERASGSIETAMLTLGQELAPYVERAAGLIELLANKFTALPSSVKGGVVIVGLLAAVLGPLLIAVGFISTGLAGLAGALALVSTPVLLVVGGIAALTAAFAAAYASSSTFRAQVSSAMQQVSAFMTASVVPAALRIRTAFMQLVAAVVPIVQQIVGVVREQMPQIQRTVSVVFSSVRSIVMSAMSIVRSVIVIATAAIRQVWATFGQTILSTISRVLSAVQTVIRGAFNVIAGIFKTVAAVLRGDWSAAWDGIKQVVSGALGVIKGLISGGFAVIRGLFSALGDLIAHFFGPPWNAVKNAFQTGVQNAVAVVKGLPDKIRGVFSGAKDLLVSIGGDIVQGLVHGIQNAAGAVLSAAQSLVDKIPGPIRKLMGIASPSKVMYLIGQQIAQGLELGITDSVPRITAAGDAVTAAVDKLSEAVKSRLDKAYDGKKLDKHLQRVQAGLKDERAAVGRAAKAYDVLVNSYNATRAAGQEAYDKIIERLDTAKQKLAELQDQQASYAAQIRDSVVDFGSVVGLGGREDEAGTAIAATAATIIEDLRKRAQEAASFAGIIAQLTAAGLNETSLQQLLAAGVEGGMAAAQAIAAGGVGAVTEINALTAQIASTGAAMGASTSAQFYGHGVAAAAAVADGISAEAAASAAATAALLAGIALEIDAAEDKTKRKMRQLGKAAQEGLLEGLVGDEDKLGKAAERLAKRIEREVKQALGIKSPSRVFREIGHMTGAGLVVGMEGMTAAVRDAAAGMVGAAGVGVPGVNVGAVSAAAQRAAAGVQAGPPSVRVFIGDRELTDIVDVRIGDTFAPLTTLTRQGA